MEKYNPYVIHICTTEDLLKQWLRECRLLYTFTGRMKTESSWVVGPGNEKPCCFCPKRSTYYLFEGYHNHYCPIKHPVCRGILCGGEVNVCQACLDFLAQCQKTSKQFIQNLLYIYWINYIDEDVINIIAVLFQKVIIKSHPRIFMDC